MTSNENLYGSEFSHFRKLYDQNYYLRNTDAYAVLNLLTNEIIELHGNSPKEAIKNFAKTKMAEYRIYESYEEMSSECISYAEKYTLLTKRDKLKYFSLHSAKILKDLSYADSLKYSINTADTFRNITELVKSLKKNSLISYYKITDNDGDSASQGKVVVIRSLYCGIITKTYKSVCFQNKENKQLRRIVNMVEFVNSDSPKDA